MSAGSNRFKWQLVFRSEDTESGATAETTHGETGVSASGLAGVQEKLMGAMAAHQAENAAKLRKE